MALVVNEEISKANYVTALTCKDLQYSQVSTLWKTASKIMNAFFLSY